MQASRFMLSAPLALLLVLGGPAQATGERPEVASILAQPEITLADLFRLVELESPRLAADRAGLAARAGLVRQAGLYPNPELGLAVGEMSVDDPAQRKQKIELSQALLIGGRRAAAVDQARAALAVAGHQAEQLRRDTLADVHRLWVELAYHAEKAVVLAELRAVAVSSSEIARTRFEARAAPEAHLTRARLEVYELDVQLQQLEQDRLRSLAELSVALGGIVIPPERLAGDLVPLAGADHWVQAADSLLADHPRRQASELAIAAAAAALRTARAERIPDLTVSVAYGRFEGDAGNFVEGGISIPVPLFHRNQGRIAETGSLVVQADHEARLVADELAVQLAATHRAHEAAHAQLDLITRDITPAARRGLEQAREAYRLGRIMFLELVDAQRTHADVLLRTLAWKRNLALTEVDLMSLLGTGPYRAKGEIR